MWEWRGGDWFDNNITWKSGDGNRILLWEDIWIRDLPLRDKYPRIFANSNQKEARLLEVGNWYENQWKWNVLWRKEWFEWEKPMVEEMMQHIEGCTLHKQKEDEWVWRGDATQEYTVKSTYKKMQNGTIGDEETLYGTFWNVKALPTAHIFAWRVLHNRVATYDNLLKRGILLESRRCVVCDTCDESVCHLFLTCRVATQIWKLCDSWIGVSLVHHNRAKDHFLGFDMLGLNSKENCVWRTVWVAILWGI